MTVSNRRELAGSRTSMGATTESLELIRPQDFMGPPGARTPMAQPFHVHVHPQVSTRAAGKQMGSSCVCSCACMGRSTCHLMQHCGVCCHMTACSCEDLRVKRASE